MNAPDAFRAAVRGYMGRATHEALGRPVKTLVYQPMLELITELRRLDFTVGVVTGGGTEFVRAISDELYSVAPELVVGTLIGYELGRDDDRLGWTRVSIANDWSTVFPPVEAQAVATTAPG